MRPVADGSFGQPTNRGSVRNCREPGGGRMQDGGPDRRRGDPVPAVLGTARRSAHGQRDSRRHQRIEERQAPPVPGKRPQPAEVDNQRLPRRHGGDSRPTAWRTWGVRQGDQPPREVARPGRSAGCVVHHQPRQPPGPESLLPTRAGARRLVRNPCRACRHGVRQRDESRQPRAGRGSDRYGRDGSSMAGSRGARSRRPPTGQDRIPELDR